ncbi:Ankyrin-2 [Trapelia coarctata]|nr:Ankyrin-2 [Trapelia coarctata]
MDPLTVTNLVSELTSGLLASTRALQGLRISLVKDGIRDSCKGVLEETVPLIWLLSAEQASQTVEQSSKCRLESLQKALQHVKDVFTVLDQNAVDLILQCESSTVELVQSRGLSIRENLTLTLQRLSLTSAVVTGLFGLVSLERMEAQVQPALPLSSGTRSLRPFVASAASSQPDLGDSIPDDIKILCENADVSDSTLLFDAIEFDEQDIVRYLLQHGADIGAMTTTGKATTGKVTTGKVTTDGATTDGAMKDEASTKKTYGVLHAAAKKKNTEIVELLLQYGADVNQLDSDGWTPLFYAVEADDITTVRKLMHRGADLTPTSGSSEWSVLHLAVLNSNLEMFKLVSRHFTGLPTEDIDGETPLQLTRLLVRDKRNSMERWQAFLNRLRVQAGNEPNDAIKTT